MIIEGTDALVMILTLHFLADFILQSDWMAINKSSSWKALGIHTFVYTMVFMIFGWKFAVLNGVLHFITDAISSRLTSYLWKLEKRHLFFVVIGADQMIHNICLIKTADYFF